MRLFRNEAGFTSAEQELVFLTIARVNECTYCVTAHSFIAETISKTPHQAIQAVREDAAIDEPKLQALVTFTRTMVETKGESDA